LRAFKKLNLSVKSKRKKQLTKGKKIKRKRAKLKKKTLIE
jgi:hypothetical protein